jgi:hypothetical protein
VLCLCRFAYAVNYRNKLYIQTLLKMFGLCKYKDVIGAPNTGLHKRFRLFDIAMFDVVSVLIGGIVLGYVMKWNIPITIAGVFLLGIVLHRAFCVRTTVDKWLFPNA